MRNRLLLPVLCLLLLLAGCKRQAKTDRDQSRQAALQVYAQMKDSWGKADLNGLDAVFRPDAIFIDASNPGTPAHWGSLRLDVQKSAQAVHPAITDAGQPVVNIDDPTGAVWLATKYHVKAETPQGAFEGNGILTLCLLKSGDETSAGDGNAAGTAKPGAYRIVLFHASRVP